MTGIRRITLGSGDPKRLFAGGLHGDEWKYTSWILESVDAPGVGTLVVIPKLTDQDYVSTLEERYYEGYGSNLVAAIDEIRPLIYLELHSYHNFDELTDVRRIDKVGVPAYVELEDGVLIGSISPILRRRCFSNHDLCISFEIPVADQRSKSQRLVKKFLEFTKDCTSRDEFLDFLLTRYPDQGMRAVGNYKRFYKIQK